MRCHVEGGWRREGEGRDATEGAAACNLVLGIDLKDRNAALAVDFVARWREALALCLPTAPHAGVTLAYAHMLATLFPDRAPARAGAVFAP